MQTGTIRKWIDGKGFGFIRADTGGEDLFVHITRFAGSKVEPFTGDRVEFEAGTNPRTGLAEAQNVRLVE